MQGSSYFRSPSTRLGWVIGFVMYLSYAGSHHMFANTALIAISIFVGFFLPFFSRLSNWTEEKINLATAHVSFGRIGRFIQQLTLNVSIFFIFTKYGVFPAANIDSIGGVLGLSLITTFASQGIQYIGLILASRGIGDRNRNVLVGLSANTVVTALATLGFVWAKSLFMTVGIAFGGLVFIVGILSDLRSHFFPKYGIGVFFGTFNPMHKTHLALVRNAIEERGLERVYIHATVIPKLHADALKRGEIRVARREAGMRVYEKTERADVHVNYFPTGNRFYEYETRCRLMQFSIEEAGLASKVEILSVPRVYEKKAFYGVMKHVRKLAAGRPIHAIHGSDWGGMGARSIYDESGWTYPYAVARRDKVSATAIRNGVRGLTTVLVEDIIDRLRRNDSKIVIQGQRYVIKDGMLVQVKDNASKAA